MSMDSSVMPVGQLKLQTIDEDAQVLPINKLLELCTYHDEDIQANAFGYLQHLTFNNPDNKMEVTDQQGLPIIIEQIESVNNYVARAALGLLKNMAFTDLEMITDQIESLGAISKLADIIHSTNDITQKELAIDVLWNLSVKYNLKPIILMETIQTLINSVIIPDSRMLRQDSGNYVEGNEEIVWSTMLRNALGIIRNVSYESPQARATLRRLDGLVDCILYIIFQSGNREENNYEEDDQMALINTKIVENCVCILRNLTYAIQEIVDPEYLSKRRDAEQNSKKAAKTKGNTAPPKMLAPPPSADVPKGVELLWNSKYIVTALFPILKNGANAVTLEAVAGVTQNLTAGDWEPSKEMQIQFRLQLALPTLIELVDFGTNEVIRSAATALRNLVQENFCCMLVGKNGLRNLAEKIPLSSRSKRIDPTALAALLSTIYVIISDQVEFMKDFITHKGANRCLYVKQSDEFTIVGDNYPDKVKIFSHCILDLLWKTPTTQDMLKKLNIKQADINMPSTKSSNESAGHMNNMGQHASIVSDENDRGAQYPTDERYLRDSLAEIVSNSGLRERTSRAYTTSSVPGYGVVRLPAPNVKVSNRNGNLATIQSSGKVSQASGVNTHRKASNGSTVKSNRPSSRIVSPIPMQPIHSRLSADNRRGSNHPSNYSQTPRPLPIPRISNQRLSSSTNNSEVIKDLLY